MEVVSKGLILIRGSALRPYSGFPFFIPGEVIC